MNKEIEKELLNTKSFNEFREILIRNNISSIKQLSNEVLKHHSILGSGGTAERHNDPRKK